MADRSAARLDGAGQPGVRPEGGGGGAPEHPAGPAVRFAVVAGGGGGPARAGVAVPSPGPSAKGARKGFLTPLLLAGFNNSASTPPRLLGLASADAVRERTSKASKRAKGRTVTAAALRANAGKLVLVHFFDEKMN